MSFDETPLLMQATSLQEGLTRLNIESLCFQLPPDDHVQALLDANDLPFKKELMLIDLLEHLQNFLRKSCDFLYKFCEP